MKASCILTAAVAATLFLSPALPALAAKTAAAPQVQKEHKIASAKKAAPSKKDKHTAKKTSRKSYTQAVKKADAKKDKATAKKSASSKAKKNKKQAKTLS